MYRLLIVEEEKICRELENLTAGTGFVFERVDLAHNYASALDKAILMQPQIALIGMSLEEGKCWELVNQLRGLGLQTVCCLLSNHVDMRDVRRAMRAGCRDILRRIPEPDALREFLEWAMITELRGAGPEGTASEDQLDLVLGKPSSEFSKITNRILLSVRNEFRQSLSLTVIAQHYHMSSKYMGRVFLQDTGMRFTDYLLAYRMLEAKRMLLATNEKISVIAAMVGYSQLNNFYTHFHQYFEDSPSSMRNTKTNEEATK